MKEIKLTQGYVTQVDDDIYEVIKGYKWHILRRRYILYAVRNVSRKLNPDGKQDKIYLHNFIMNTPVGLSTDHIDGNGLNNQRHNLRIATNRLNQQNTCDHRKGKLVGTSWHKRDNVWLARIQIDGIMKYLGRFKTEKEAHEAYRKALDQLHDG